MMKGISSSGALGFTVTAGKKPFTGVATGTGLGWTATGT